MAKSYTRRLVEDQPPCHLISKAAGVLANLVVVLDSNLFAIPPEKIRDASVHTTIIAGKIVYHGDSN